MGIILRPELLLLFRIEQHNSSIPRQVVRQQLPQTASISPHPVLCAPPIPAPTAVVVFLPYSLAFRPANFYGSKVGSWKASCLPRTSICVCLLSHANAVRKAAAGCKTYGRELLLLHFNNSKQQQQRCCSRGRPRIDALLLCVLLVVSAWCYTASPAGACCSVAVVIDSACFG